MPFAQQFQLVCGVFLAYVGIKNAGLLKFTIDPGNYTVVGEGADKAKATIVSELFSGSRIS